ncbi:MAG: hypothetical protein IJK62_01365 [Bacteroidales bacterium]|nr:hypothetical protein [Bacteroidales bacterium]
MGQIILKSSINFAWRNLAQYSMPRRCKKLIIKEELDTLLDLLQKYESNNMIYKRIKLIIVCKKHETEGISKEELHRRTGFSGQSIINWQRMYEQGGIELLITHGRKSNRESIFTGSEQKRIIEKYSNDHISISGLRNWVLKNLGKDVKYITLYKFIQKKCPKKKLSQTTLHLEYYTLTIQERELITKYISINPEIDLNKLHDWILRNIRKDLNEQTLSSILATAKKNQSRK